MWPNGGYPVDADIHAKLLLELVLANQNLTHMRLASWTDRVVDSRRIEWSTQYRSGFKHLDRCLCDFKGKDSATLKQGAQGIIMSHHQSVASLCRALSRDLAARIKERSHSIMALHRQHINRTFPIFWTMAAKSLRSFQARASAALLWCSSEACESTENTARMHGCEWILQYLQ